jgi:hypothetical protein
LISLHPGLDKFPTPLMLSLKIFVNLTMTLKIFINLITTLKMFINFIGNTFYLENVTS